MRVRNKLRKVNAGRVRLSVHRSNKNISCQLIDDVKGLTLAAASSMEKDLGVVGKDVLLEHSADVLTLKDLGFGGKACIHPNQIEISNEIFNEK